MVSNSPGGLWKSGGVQLHLFYSERAVTGLLDCGEPFEPDAFLQRFLNFEIVGRHLLAIPAIHDQRFGCSQTFCGTRYIERGVAAAVHQHAPPQQRRIAAVHISQDRERVQNPARIAGRDVGALRHVSTHGEKCSIEFVFRHHASEVVYFRVQRNGDAHVLDACDLRVQNFARQPVLRNAHPQHAARSGPRLGNGYPLPRARQLIRRR
jgi:hypothetical protein